LDYIFTIKIESLMGKNVAKLIDLNFFYVLNMVIPYHAWLTRSLNSPTPVSALMHAGLVNGGGFILVKFSPHQF